MNEVLRILKLVLSIYVSAYLSSAACKAVAVKIVGEAQFTFINSQKEYTEDVIETSDLVIIEDGSKYDILCDTKTGANVGKEEVGSDGVDNFMINGGITPWNISGKGHTGFASSGRFPKDCRPEIQAVWLAYCSKDYFSKSNNSTGFPLHKFILSMSPPEYVTNFVTYWPYSTLPKMVMGWGRKRVFFNGISEGFDADQYPNGYKAWEYLGTDDIAVGKERFPKRISLQGFLPWTTEKTNVTSGEDVQPLRKVTFIAHSIEAIDSDSDLLPTVNVADLSIIDSRFTNAGKYIVVSHADPTNGWPVRTDAANPSLAYKKAEIDANQIALDNGLVRQTESTRVKIIIGIILMVNLTIFFAYWFSTQNKTK